MADRFKNKVFLVIDGEHKRWPSEAHTVPFAFGACVVRWDSEKGKYIVDDRYNFRVLIQQPADGHPEQLEFWQTKFPEMYQTLTSPEHTKNKKAAADLLEQYMHLILANLVEPSNLKLCIGLDDPNDLIMADNLLVAAGKPTLRRLCNPRTGHCSVYDLESWLEGRDEALETQIAATEKQLKISSSEKTEIEKLLSDHANTLDAASLLVNMQLQTVLFRNAKAAEVLNSIKNSCELKLSKNTQTTHAHTHDPLDDALHLAELVVGALNADL